jgi:hypothetical protein
MAITQEQLNRILGKQSVVQRAFNENRPTVTNTPRNIISGTYADLLKPLTNNLVGDIVLGDVQRGLNSASYGQPLTTGGSVQTGGFRPEYLALALGLTPMGKGKKAAEGFSELAASGKLVQAKNKTQELDDLVKGKSKFAEVKLNWDDPKSYDLADKLEKQGFMSTVIDQGRDQVTLFHKKPEDIASIVSAKTPYDYGKAYGYSDADVAKFYKERYGNEAEKYFQQDRQFTPKKTEFEVAQETAQRNAALPVSEGGLGLPSTNTAMDRAKAMGYTNPAYHGTSNPSLQNLNELFYSAKNPNLANEYSKSATELDEGYKSTSNVIPLLTNLGKNKKLNTHAQYENEFMQSQNGVDFGENPYYWNNEGYDSATHAYPKDAKNSIYLNFNPADVRSRFAAFDPFRRNEADILAGVGVGVPTAGLLDEKKKK